ncbi:MAG TPA: hypothetical protein VJV78_40175 [Polyangiales bacterium]|nr:hypothetical protein [Polyangiales bacterium]
MGLRELGSGGAQFVGASRWLVGFGWLVLIAACSGDEPAPRRDASAQDDDDC